jgi:(p)ppGpp synthase/HD superfamily hydrolase
VNRVELAQKIAKNTLPIKKYEHSVRVGNKVKHLGKEFEIVALLHEVLDCKNVNVDILEEFFNKKTIHSIDLLSKKEFMHIENPFRRDRLYLSRIFSSDDAVAKAVKIYDAIDNLMNRPIPPNKHKLVSMTIQDFYIKAAKVKYPSAYRWLSSRLEAI